MQVEGAGGRTSSFEVTDPDSGHVFYSKLKAGKFPEPRHIINLLKQAGYT